MMKANSVRRSLTAGLVLAGFWMVPPAVAQTPPTKLRVGNFQFADKVHRFSFEWDAAKTVAGAPYPKYQLSSGKGCWYEKLNPADRILKEAAAWSLYPSGPRLGVTVVCGCPRAVWGYNVGLRALGTGLPPQPAMIRPEDVPADKRHATLPSYVVLDCR
jgi:hypothetical protein